MLCVYPTLKTTRTCSTGGKFVCDYCVCGLLVALFDKPHTTLSVTTVTLPSGVGIELSTLLLFAASLLTSWTPEKSGRVYRHVRKEIPPPPVTQYVRIKRVTHEVKKGRGLLIHQSLNGCNVWAPRLRRSSWRDYTRMA